MNYIKDPWLLSRRRFLPRLLRDLTEGPAGVKPNVTIQHQGRHQECREPSHENPNIYAKVDKRTHIRSKGRETTAPLDVCLVEILPID